MDFAKICKKSETRNYKRLLVYWLLHFKKIVSKTSIYDDNLIDVWKNIFVFLGKLWVKMSKKGQEKQVPDFHMDAIKEEESCLKCIDIGGN